MIFFSNLTKWRPKIQRLPCLQQQQQKQQQVQQQQQHVQQPNINHYQTMICAINHRFRKKTIGKFWRKNANIFIKHQTACSTTQHQSLPKCDLLYQPQIPRKKIF